MIIKVNAKNGIKEIQNFWNNIHFHPTDAIEDEWGKRILDKVSEDKAARYIRIYAMLEDIVKTDGDGNLIYDFTLTDKRIDYLVSCGFKLLICFNFMPEGIAQQLECISRLERYKGKNINTSRPRDYSVWQSVCAEYTRHLTQRYGDEVSSWYFHCWNEPDIPIYWMSQTPREGDEYEKEYEKLYDYFAEGVSSVSEKIKIGGPSATQNEKFINQFLKHTSSGKNNANGKIGTRLDFFSIHTYGTSAGGLNNGAEITPDSILAQCRKWRKTADENGYKDIEIIVDEWGVSSEGFCSIEHCPRMEFRNTEMFAAYYARLIRKLLDINISKMMICLSGQHNLKRDFEGYRNFFTLNFFRKPIYNAYVLAAMLGNKLLQSTGENDKTGTVPTICEDGSVRIIIYSQSQNNETVELNITGLSGRYSISHFRIDSEHSNSYTEWCKMGRPDNPDQSQREIIMQAGNIESLYSGRDAELNGEYTEIINMPPNSFSMIMFDRR